MPTKITVTIATRGPRLVVEHDDVRVTDYDFAAEFKDTEPEVNPTALMKTAELCLFTFGYHPDFDKMRLTDDVQVLSFHKVKG